MNPVTALEGKGYVLKLDGDNIGCTRKLPASDPAVVRQLLAELKTRKAQALTFLRLRQIPEHLSLNDLDLYGPLLTPSEWRWFYRLE